MDANERFPALNQKRTTQTALPTAKTLPRKQTTLTELLAAFNFFF